MQTLGLVHGKLTIHICLYWEGKPLLTMTVPTINCQRNLTFWVGARSPKKLERYHSLHACAVMSDSVTPWTVALQAPPSMGFSRQEYWGRLSFPSPGDLPDPGIKPAFPATPALAGGFFTTEPPGKPISLCTFPEGRSGSCHSQKEVQSPGRSWRRRCDERESVRPHSHLLL